MHLFLALMLSLAPAFAGDDPPADPASIAADGWWNPAENTWSRAGITTAFKKVKETPAPSVFLGDTSGMKNFSKAEWAWVASDFNPESYATVAVAPVSNSMGRYKVTGENLVRTLEVDYLQGVTKKWKKKVTAGTSGDLVVYTNLHWFSTTANGVEYVVEVMGVDKSNNVQFKLQYLAGTSGTANMVMGAMSGGVGGMVSSIPDDKDQFGYYTATAAEVGGILRTVLVDAAVGIKKGKNPPPMSAAVPLHIDVAALAPKQKEEFGPLLQKQIADLIAFANDPNGDVKDRGNALRDLGKIGATAAIPACEAYIQDPKAKNSIQENSAWALGEIGHADAMDTLSVAKGVDGFNVKAAITKITVY